MKVEFEKMVTKHSDSALPAVVLGSSKIGNHDKPTKSGKSGKSAPFRTSGVPPSFPSEDTEGLGVGTSGGGHELQSGTLRGKKKFEMRCEVPIYVRSNFA